MRCRTRRREPGAQREAPSLAQALALGVLHGPAELLPVSSSAHVAAIPWLLGWSYGELGDELRKSFEVALHAGAAVAWLISPATEDAGILRTLRHPSRGQAVFLLLASAPAAAAGFALERPIERRLGRPGTIATGLLGGALAMAVADRAPQRREADEAQGPDALWLGLAQAAALLPGISRTGATLAAARARGFTRPAARRLSARSGWPIIMGATGLKLIRTLERPAGDRLWLAAGAGASFLSTLMMAPLVARTEDRLSLVPFAVYRAALAGAILARLRMG